MMFFNIFKIGINSLPSADSNLRSKLEIRIQNEGITALHDELSILNKEIAISIQPQDTQRIIRALEIIYHSAGSSQSVNAETKRMSLTDQYDLYEYGIFPKDRSLLHSRIEARQHELISGGLLQEVQGLNKKYDLSPDHPAMKAVNYRQALQVINGELSADDLFERSLYATRQLAKRQCTWMRSWEDFHAFDIHEFQQLSTHLKKHLNFA